MLKARRKPDGHTVLAYFERPSNGPFACIKCGEQVLLKTGKSRGAHFAQADPLACRWPRREKGRHRRCKLEIWQALLNEPCVTDMARELPLGRRRCRRVWPGLSCVTDMARELPLGPVRPDVFAYVQGVPVAIELQVSYLSVTEIRKRTIWYSGKGMYVLWLLLWNPALDAETYQLMKWERWLHALYFARAYDWVNGLNLLP